jgi:Post-segregation antitoxin CcdA
MAKRKITVTIDEDLLDSIPELGTENVSSLLNKALRTELEARARHQALGLLLEELRIAHGEPTEEALRAAEDAFAELEGEIFVHAKVA